MTKKKLALSIGSMLVVTTPVVALISCSSPDAPHVQIDPMYGEYTQEQVEDLNGIPGQIWVNGEPKYVFTIVAGSNAPENIRYIDNNDEDDFKINNPKFNDGTETVQPPILPNQPNTQQTGITQPNGQQPVLSNPISVEDNVQDINGVWRYIDDGNGNLIPNTAWAGFLPDELDEITLEILSDYGLSLGHGILAIPRSLPAPWPLNALSDETIVYKWASAADVSSLDSFRSWKIANMTEDAIRRQFDLVGPNEFTLLSPRTAPLILPGVTFTHAELVVYKWYRRPAPAGMPPAGPDGLPVSIYDVRSYINGKVGSTPGGALYLSGPVIPVEKQMLIDLGVAPTNILTNERTTITTQMIAGTDQTLWTPLEKAFMHWYTEPTPPGLPPYQVDIYKVRTKILSIKGPSEYSNFTSGPATRPVPSNPPAPSGTGPIAPPPLPTAPNTNPQGSVAAPTNYPRPTMVPQQTPEIVVPPILEMNIPSK